MRHRLRAIIVGVVALCGILLVAWGTRGWDELLHVGEVPPERLGAVIGYTIVPFVLGLALILWCLVAGIAWARGKPPAQ